MDEDEPDDDDENELSLLVEDSEDDGANGTGDNETVGLKFVVPDSDSAEEDETVGQLREEQEEFSSLLIESEDEGHDVEIEHRDVVAPGSSPRPWPIDEPESPRPMETLSDVLKTDDDPCFCRQTLQKIKNDCLRKILVSIEGNYPRLQTRIFKSGPFDSIEALEISRLKVDVPASRTGGPHTVAMIRVLDSGKGALCVNGQVRGEEFDVFAGQDILWDNLEARFTFLSTKFSYCAGIERTLYDSSTKQLRFLPKYLEIDAITNTVRSTKCPLLFDVRFNVTREEREMISRGEGRCRDCSFAFRKARGAARRTAQFSPATLKHRASPSSKYPIKLLSPCSVRQRYSRLRQMYQNQAAKVKRYCEKLEADLTIDLEEEQSKELENFVGEISSDDVEELLNEHCLQQQGDEDSATPSDDESKKAAILEAFQADQTKNRKGSHGNRWNIVTYRIALSIFTRSPQTYREIGKWGIFQLPSVSSLRQYTTAYLQREGPYYIYLEEQHKKYQDFIKAHKEGTKLPIGEGVLILDEVKVAGKVIWNSKDGRISGLAMDKEDCLSLTDIFDMLSDKPKSARDPAQYVLQFLWRDLSSKFDVIGPHYTSATTMTASFTASCLWDAMHAFQMYGFVVCVVVMDGASSNLAMVKLLSGFGKGPYGLNGPPDDIHAVTPWFTNPEFPDRTIYLMMCPTHQLKNMINTLWASREGRPKALQYGRGKKTFGWKEIEGMWERERQKRPKSIRLVKKLVKSYIDRDSWTKLNVEPAKIMQQPEVLRELYSYANPDEGDPPDDQESVMATHAYLKACSQLFEDGFLRTGFEGRIYNVDNSTTMQNIMTGFEFFKSWINKLIEDFDDFSHTKSTEKRFLAWQTYDLLRLAVYSFRAFCTDFLARNEGYYVVPLKLNGSAVETLFSQFKAAAGGKLTSVNYAFGKRSKQLQREVRGDAGGYRNAPLYTAFEPLRKKKKM